MGGLDALVLGARNLLKADDRGREPNGPYACLAAAALQHAAERGHRRAYATFVGLILSGHADAGVRADVAEAVRLWRRGELLSCPEISQENRAQARAGPRIRSS